MTQFFQCESAKIFFVLKARSELVGGFREVAVTPRSPNYQRAHARICQDIHPTVRVERKERELGWQKPLPTNQRPQNGCENANPKSADVGSK